MSKCAQDFWNTLYLSYRRRSQWFGFRFDKVMLGFIEIHSALSRKNLEFIEVLRSFLIQ